jgi:ABC-type branched-subunit amino acid transport system ATPase component
MLTRLRVKRFKRFDDVDIELGRTVVLIGPNDSGKTAALQALALWETGLRRWVEKRGSDSVPEKRPGVTVNRRDLIAIPVPEAKLLWHDLHVRNVHRDREGKQKTGNVCVEVLVNGVQGGRKWECGLEFDYANPESLYCRPLRRPGGSSADRMAVPPEALGVRVAFLPPMSGLAATEPKWEPGRINVLLGEGQTAQVLRNLCYQLHEEPRQPGAWDALTERIKALFGVELGPPEHVQDRGEITMAYRHLSGPQLDISASGRGLQQTLLLLGYLYANPGAVLLLDEPDAHLEILRQRQTYQIINEIGAEQGCQIIAASHSEVVLNEAAGRDTVIAFVGRPHRIDDRGSQVLKALRDIGFEDYYQAEQKGWVLYLEGSSDLAILRAFADRLGHPAAEDLQQPFVHYVQNSPAAVLHHFHGLREAKPDVVGIAILDRLDRADLAEHPRLAQVQWQRREIENYLCREEVLIAYARETAEGDLFAHGNEATMRECINDMSAALATLGHADPWSGDIKATDQFLDPLFRNYLTALGLPILMDKSSYHELAKFLTPDMIPHEVNDKLDRIAEVAQQASPRGA